MATVSRSRIVTAPARVVWDVLADFGAISSWVARVEHSCVLEHGAGGSPVGTSRRVQVGRTTLVERITEFTAPTALGYDIEGLPRRLRRVANRWTVTPAGDRTVATLTSTVDIGDGAVARIAERAVCRVMARQSDAMLSGLAERVEAPR